MGSSRPLAAQRAPGTQANHELSLGLSFHDVSGRLGNGTALELSYQPPWLLFDAVRPSVGTMLASDGAVYGFLGIRLPLTFNGDDALTPSFGIGAFGAGEDADLGSVLEFRSGITMALDFFGGHPVGISFYHLSNAGLSRPNPGMEFIELSYSVPW